MENCEHILHFPKPPLDGKNHCGFYSKHTIKGRHWAHYPECKEENCPLIHHELLEGAILKREA